MTQRLTPDQERRVRECAFDQDITDILQWGIGTARNWAKIAALMDCLTDIRDILDENAGVT